MVQAGLDSGLAACTRTQRRDGGHSQRDRQSHRSGCLAGARYRLTKQRSAATSGSVEDGAAWITPWAQKHCPGAGTILDQAHLWRMLRDAVRSLHPDKQRARLVCCKEQSEVLLPRLWKSKRERAWAHVRDLCPARGEAPLACEEAFQDLETQWDWISDGYTWEEQGPLVAVAWWNELINLRLNRCGLRRMRATAPAIVASRVQRSLASGMRGY